MLWTILNKSWRQHTTRHQLYDHLPPITKTIQARRTKHAGHCWRSKDELISDVLLWTPAYGQAKAGRPARTYIQQFSWDTGCSPEDLPETMNDRKNWRERVRDIRATSPTWWCWWYTKLNKTWIPNRARHYLSMFHLTNIQDTKIDQTICFGGVLDTHRVVANVLDRVILESKFEPQLRFLHSLSGSCL